MALAASGNTAAQLRARCPACCCHVRANHRPDDAECQGLQVERQVRADVRAAEWVAG